MTTSPQNLNILYRTTKAKITALTGVTTGSIAYATDTKELGTYNGSSWIWEDQIDSSGWVHSFATWSYSSADAPTFVISVNADMTALIGKGDRIKVTQSGADKYFIVTKMGTYSGGATLITVYGGTTHTLANSAISNPCYSHFKSPAGFESDPTSWTETFVDTTQRIQASPTYNTWYNIGSLSFYAPIGLWKLSYSVTLGTDRASAGGCAASFTISHMSNAEATSELSVMNQAGNVIYNLSTLTRAYYPLSLTSKTLEYLLGRADSTNISNLYFFNTFGALNVHLVCAYL